MKVHANTVVFLLTANTPIIHVTPSRGSSTIVFLIEPLHIMYYSIHLATSPSCVRHLRDEASIIIT